MSVDRTAEFRRFIDKQPKGPLSVGHPPGTHASKRPGHSSQFKCAAVEIAQRLNDTSATLESLHKLATKRHVSIDNAAGRIDELTHHVKQSITTLNGQLDALAALQQREYEYRKNGHTEKHNTKVISSLRIELKETTKRFHQVLEQRTESLKAQQQQTRELTGHISSLDMNAPTSLGFGSLDGSSTGEVAIRMPGGGNLDMMAVEDYDSTRVTSVENIQRTMVELQGIFQKIGELVHIQGDMIERIDANIEDSIRDVEGAHGEIMRYMMSISGNRGLAVKIFLVLIFFIVIFVLFFL